MQVYFRADANDKIGSGHIMRCIALAQLMKKSGVHIVFIINCSSQEIINRIINEGFTIAAVESSYPSKIDVFETLSIIRSMGSNHQPTWVVIDGYHFNDDYFLQIRKSGSFLLYVNDYVDQEFIEPNILLNQNHGSEKKRVNEYGHQRFLMGATYALLRDEIIKSKKNSRLEKNGNRVLLTYGGSDEHNVTEIALKSLGAIHNLNLNIVVVLGPLNANKKSLEALSLKMHHNCEIRTNVTDMGSYMNWADLALSASGSTCWEMAYLNLPFIITITARNQEMIAKQLVDSHCCLSTGWYHQIDINQFTIMIENLLHDLERRVTFRNNSKALVDGRGRDRILEAMVNYS